MKYSISIAMVVILMAAAFVGVVAMDDESDAATSYTISVDKADTDWAESWAKTHLGDEGDFKKKYGITEISNSALKNNLSVVDGKVVGTVTKAPVNGDQALVEEIWPDIDAKDAPYMFVINIGDLLTGSYVSYLVKENGADVVKSANVTGTSLSKTFCTDGSIKSFEYVVTTYDMSGNTSEKIEAFKIAQKQTVEFDIEFIGNEVSIQYTVGDLIYTQKSNEEKVYKLVTIDDLRADVPVGQKFIGWTDGKDVYPVGTAFVLSQNLTFTAVFEDITPVVTFAVNGEVIPELTKTIKYGEKIVAPEVPEGCTGWNFDFTQAIFADVQIDAVLEEVPEVQVTFFDGITYYGPVKVSEIKDKVPTVTKDGHNFVGWFIDGVKVDPLAYEFTEDTTLVAGWDPIKCKVVFMVGGVIYKEQTVEYGKTATEAVLPEGYSAWDFKFDTPITKDLTVITAIEKAPEKPTGLADPTVKMALVIVGLFVCVLLAVIILKREDIRAGMVRKLSKTEEDKKE